MSKRKQSSLTAYVKEKENRKPNASPARSATAASSSATASSTPTASATPSSAASVGVSEPATKKPKPSPVSTAAAAAAAPVTMAATKSPLPMGGARAAPRMVIKPFKTKPKPPAEFEQNTMQALHTAVEAVYARTAIDASREELYRSVESLCMHKKAPELFDALRKQMAAHTERTVRELTALAGPSTAAVAATAATAGPTAAAASVAPMDVASTAATGAATASPSASASASSSSSSAVDTATFLARVEVAWAQTCEQLLTIRSIFLYLDRTHVIHQHSATNNEVRSLWDMGLALFRDHFKAPANAALERRLVAGLLQAIERERNGETVNRPVVKQLLRMLIALRLYRPTFEHVFLSATTAFYEAEGARLMHELNVTDYLAHVMRRINEENDRVVHYLDEVTRTPLLVALRQQLVGRHTTALLTKGFDKLMGGSSSALPAAAATAATASATVMDTSSSSAASASGSTAASASASTAAVIGAPMKHELAVMYALFARVDALVALRDAFGEFVQKTGLAVVNDAPRDNDMVKTLLAFKVGLDDALSASFEADATFADALNRAFSHFLNARGNRPAELVAKYVDKKLRAGAGAKGSTDAELERDLRSAMAMFRFISAKDVFQAFYRDDLAKRLLMAKSASIDAERLMIALIKAECGGAFTSKLDMMFTDIEQSKELVSAFEARLKETDGKDGASDRPASDMEFGIQVLQAGAWPDYKAVDVKLPPEVNWFQEKFRASYTNKHSGRRLTYQNPLATVVMKAHFPKGRRELVVSGFQAAVLYAFNGAGSLVAGGKDSLSAVVSPTAADSLSFKQLLAETGLEEKELKRTLQSLALPDDPAVRVLVKEPKSKSIDSGDVFRVNGDFKHKLFRIKINQIQLKETKEEHKQTNAKIEVERQYAIDAALVRIMKARKSLSHNLLIVEATQQLKFNPTVADIKKRIATLIDREYIERDKDDSQMYKYMA